MAKGQQRDPKREAFWRGVLGRYSKSGLTIRGFCQREKVTEAAFYVWRRELRHRDRDRQAAPAFVPLVVCDDSHRPADGGITVELRGGRVLRLPTMVAVERLAELVRAVESVAVSLALPAHAEARL
jgi:transposase-like protein